MLDLPCEVGYSASPITVNVGPMASLTPNSILKSRKSLEGSRSRVTLEPVASSVPSESNTGSRRSSHLSSGASSAEVVAETLFSTLPNVTTEVTR